MKHITTATIAIFFMAILLNACKSKVETNNQPITTTVSSLNYTDATKPANRLFPDKLRYLPVEILAAHFPNPCYATLEDSMYIWKHNITVKTNEDLQIVEYGSFVFTEKGWYLRVKFTPTDFEKSYNCKGGLLKKGITYTDNESWRRDTKLIAGDAMWYFIAKDKNGKLVKGTAPIETEAKLVSYSKNDTTIQTQKASAVINAESTKVIKSSKTQAKLILPIIKNAIIESEKISWTGYGEIGGYSLTGTIKTKDANIILQNDSIKKAIIVLDMPTLNHDNKDLENHLKGEDFFDVQKYPSANFETETIEYLSTTNAIAKGKLTIKGITKPIAIPLQISEDGKTKTVKGKISVDRTVFGIKYNSKSFFGNLGDKAIRNNFDVAFEFVIH